ncbi:MAG: alpha/beta hydrolase [Clostridia bacterium]|nr:alpha/beta hydrolase [Clostridia bacterium]
MLHTRITLPETGVSILTYLQTNEACEETRRRPLVVLCPGGGYKHRVPHEGEPVALRLMTMGISVVIVEYSCEPAVFPTALNEAAEAVAYCRAHAEEWCCQPDHIAIMGFSAGGHLAASLGVFWQTLPYGKAGRPDAMILCYPVITSGEHRHDNSFVRLLGKDYPVKMPDVSIETHVTSDAPPAFLWHTWEDEIVPVENSLLMATALKKAGVPCEMHIYAHGPHGTALCNEESCKAHPHDHHPENGGWIELAARWLKNI